MGEVGLVQSVAGFQIGGGMTKHANIAHQRAVERRIALMAAHGKPQTEIAQEIGRDRTTVSRILNKPEVAALVEQFMVKSEMALEEILVKGEKRAAETLVELLGAESTDVRLKAAIRLTDMAGRSGKPAERVQVQSVKLTGDAAEAALAQAIRDPGVRAWLAANPSVESDVRRLLPAQGGAHESDHHNQTDAVPHRVYVRSRPVAPGDGGGAEPPDASDLVDGPGGRAGTDAPDGGGLAGLSARPGHGTPVGRPGGGRFGPAGTDHFRSDEGLGLDPAAGEPDADGGERPVPD